MANKSAKATAAPAAAEAAEFAIEEGTKVRFLGYGPDVPEEDRVIPEGAELTISGFGADGTEEEGAIFATFANPDFNPKKKEHPDTNSRLIETQVLDTEIGPLDVEESATKAADKAADKAAAKPAAKSAPAKAATTKPANTKAADKAEAADKVSSKGKGKGKAVAKKVAEQEVSAKTSDELPDLDNEDETVRALVEENEGNLVAIAQDLEAQAATSEYHLGGVLYHIKKSGEYKTIDDGAYAGEGGWRDFMEAYFNTKYRKGQYLIEIYQAFSLKGIENAAEIVAGMGWSKAAKIANPILNDYDPDELIEAANTNTVEDLSTVIKELKSEGGTAGTAGERVPKLTIKFRLVAEDATTADTILKAAMEQQGVTDAGEAFMTILVDWYNNNIAAGEAAQTAAETAQQAAPNRRKKVTA